MAQQYDFVLKVQEEVETLQRELSEPGVEQGIKAVQERLELPHDLALAALFRAAKRSGYTLKVLIEEVNRQLDAAQARQATQRRS